MLQHIELYITNLVTQLIQYLLVYYHSYANKSISKELSTGISLLDVLLYMVKLGNVVDILSNMLINIVSFV